MILRLSSTTESLCLAVNELNREQYNLNRQWKSGKRIASIKYVFPPPSKGDLSSHSTIKNQYDQMEASLTYMRSSHQRPSRRGFRDPIDAAPHILQN